MRKRFCVRGHDIEVVGRYSNRNCKACSVENRNDWLRRKGPKDKATKRRYYLLHREAAIARAKARRLADPETHRRDVRKSRLKYRGVNFWVEAAKESV